MVNAANSCFMIDRRRQRVYKSIVSGGVVSATGFLTDRRVVSRRQQAVNTAKPPLGKSNSVSASTANNKQTHRSNQ
jgi:hypothetical protein